MTDNAPQPPMPDFPPQPEQPASPVATPAPAGRKWLSNKVVIGAAAAVIATVIGTGIFVVQAVKNDGKPTSTAVSDSPTEDSTTAVVDDPASEPDLAYADPTPDSFTISLHTTRKQCFGSAGCNVTVEPKLSYIGLTEELDPDATYEITYEIKGDESGTIIGTAELSDRTTLNYTRSSLSTASSDTKLSIEITGIQKAGL